MRLLQYWLKPHVPSHAWCLGRYYVRVAHCCVKAVAPWTTPCLFLPGIQLGMTSRRKVVMTDASSSGWGALYVGNPSFGSWLIHEQCLHINCFEMMAVRLALKTFLLVLKVHNVLVHLDNTTVVAYINRQGGLRSRSLYRMTWHLLAEVDLFASEDNCHCPIYGHVSTLRPKAAC